MTSGEISLQRQAIRWNFHAMSSRGENREQPSISDDSAQLSLEHGCLGVALVALVVAIGGLLVQSATHQDMLRGGYSILAALIVCGLAGFLTKLVLRRVAVLLAVLLEVRELLRQWQGVDRLAELTSTVQDLRAQLAELTPARPKLAGACRVPPVYTSRASQGDALGISLTTVDFSTDPAGAMVERAREDGIEEGFEIGYRTKLAEHGVTPLPRPRRPRLTGDS